MLAQPGGIRQAPQLCHKKTLRFSRHQRAFAAIRGQNKGSGKR
jgi:hypothetical protein